MLYMIKGDKTVPTFVEIVHQSDDVCKIRITRQSGEGDERTSFEFMSRQLLDTCLRTGYLESTGKATASA